MKKIIFVVFFIINSTFANNLCKREWAIKYYKKLVDNFKNKILIIGDLTIIANNIVILEYGSFPAKKQELCSLVYTFR